MTEQRSDGSAVAPDPLGESLAAFLTDLVDNIDVRIRTDIGPEPSQQVMPLAPVRGTDGRSRQFSFDRRAPSVDGSQLVDPVADELGDLPAAALRALDRLSRQPPASEPVHPSVAKALHDLVVAEVLAHRIARRLPDADPEEISRLVADTLDYCMELAATRLEGRPVTHGVVIASDWCGLQPVEPAVAYPGRLPTRKRTTVLFDGTEAALVVTASGSVLATVGRDSLPSATGSKPIGIFDAVTGLDGALTAAASAAFGGIGVVVRADQSIWVFDQGEPLLIRRTNRWKSIPIRSFAETLRTLGRTSSIEVADRLARAALRSSVQGQGAVFAIADGSTLEDLVQQKDLHPAQGTSASAGTVDDDLHRLIGTSELRSSASLARLARLDGATVISRDGDLLAYGAIVRSADSRGEGARTAAARALSTRAHLSICVSQDGLITVFCHGELVFEVL